MKEPWDFSCFDEESQACVPPLKWWKDVKILSITLVALDLEEKMEGFMVLLINQVPQEWKSIKMM